MSLKSSPAPFPPLVITGSSPVYKQLSDQLRGYILDGTIPAGSKLPTIRDLAAQVGTSYFTVQEAVRPLVRDGLVERTPSRGTYVLGNQARLTSVMFYMGDTMKALHGGFYQALYTSVFEKLEARGVENHLIMDTRPRDLQGEPNPQLMKAIQNSEAQAVIGAMLYPAHVKWLNQLEVPVAAFTSTEMQNAVHYQFSEIARLGLQQLQARGGRSFSCLGVGLPRGGKFHEEVEAQGARLGLERVDIPWDSEDERWADSYTKKGYRGFHNLWTTSRRPDGLFVFPDSCVPGVLLAMTELGVTPPNDLHLVMHRNFEIPYLCPMKSDWVSVKIEDIADALIHSIDQQIGGKTSEFISVPVSVEPGY